MAKELRKICAGLVHARDRTWFTELSDKDKLSMEYLAIQQEIGAGGTVVATLIYFAL